MKFYNRQTELAQLEKIGQRAHIEMFPAPTNCPVTWPPAHTHTQTQTHWEACAHRCVLAPTNYPVCSCVCVCVCVSDPTNYRVTNDKYIHTHTY